MAGKITQNELHTSVNDKIDKIQTIENDVTGLAEQLTNVSEDVTNIKTEIKSYSSYASSKDANGIYTIVDYKRADGTLYMKSTLSGGTSPKYTTDTWNLYDALGTTVIKTITWTLTYDADGKIISKVVA